MTAVCPSGGTSDRRGGVADHVILTAAYVGSFLPLQAQWMLNAIASGLGIEDIETASFCAIDPPADPGLDALDGLAIVTAAPEFERPGARARLSQAVRRFAWYQLCTCTATGPLNPPTTPTIPTGWPSTNPTGIVGLPVAPCLTESYSRALASGDAKRDLVSGQICDQVGQPLCSSLARPIPTGAVQWSISETADSPGAVDTNIAHFWLGQITFYNGSTFVSQISPTIQDYGNVNTINNGKHSTPANIPATATHYVIQGNTGTGGFAWTCSATVNWYCAPADTVVPTQNCCTASDPITQGMLASILQMVTLLQRQDTPFAYISGTAHHSLTGSGTLAVQGILGALLNVSIPAGYGVEFGTPDTNFAIGDLRWGTADGYSERVFIDTSDQVVLPASAGLYTLIAYNLSPGVSMTLTELVRES